MNRMKTKVQKKINWEHIEDFYNSYGRNLFNWKKRFSFYCPNKNVKYSNKIIY